MSILSGFFKTKRYRKTADGYKLESNWTSGNTVELDDGNTVQNNLGAIKGITTSTSVTEEGYAADATTVAALNNSLGNIGIVISSESYSGVISANGIMPKSMVLPAGTWLIVTSGYVGYNNVYHPFAISLNYGHIVYKGMSPSCVVKLDKQTTISIINILGAEATAFDLVLSAISL